MTDSAGLPAAGIDDGSSSLFEENSKPQINVTGYVTGTQIRTVQGDTPIDSLKVGDCVATSSGEMRPIRWLGYCTLSGPDLKNASPIRIAAHAIAEGRPALDLYVSPKHTVCIDALGEVLIPAEALINGSTITQVERDEITYWHVELDSHDILIAENLPCESYIDIGNRALFVDASQNNLEVDRKLKIVPAADPKALGYCRPFYDNGTVPDVIRLILRTRARKMTPGWRLETTPFADLHLLVDGQVMRPSVEGLSARFLVPTTARDVRLMSTTVAPAEVVDGSSDHRLLGVSLAEIVIDDGLTGARKIDLNDARLNTGFYPPEFVGDAVHWRWTGGAAVLPYSLWEGCREMFFLRITLASPALPRWIGPSER